MESSPLSLSKGHLADKAAATVKLRKDHRTKTDPTQVENLSLTQILPLVSLKQPLPTATSSLG